MIKVIKYSVEINEPIDKIDLVSESINSLNIWCYTDEKIYCFKFNTFLSCYNKDELLIQEDNNIEFEKIVNSDWNYPFGWIRYIDLIDDVPNYEKMSYNESTKKWFFLSMLNWVEICTNDSPQVTISDNEKKPWKINNIGLGKNTVSYTGTAIIEIACPAFLSGIDERTFFASLDSISFSPPKGISNSIQVELAITKDLNYLREIFGLFTRYHLNMKQLLKIINDENKNIFFDSKKYWYNAMKGIK